MTLIIPKKYYQKTSGLRSLSRSLILFMAGVNLVASAFDATLPGYVLPNPKGGQAVTFINCYSDKPVSCMFIAFKFLFAFK